MRRVFLTLLITIMTIAAFTVGGVVLLSHENDMMAPMDAACISNCISSNTVTGTVTAITNTNTLLMFFVVVLFLSIAYSNTKYTSFQNNLDRRKHILHQQLATVLIRD